MDKVNWKDMTKDEFLESIVHLYGDEVYRICYTYVKRKDIAEDLTQDIFLKCYKYFHTFKGNSSVKTWIYRIAINHCKDYRKSAYHQYILLSEKISQYAKGKGKSPEAQVIEKDETERFTKIVMTLPVKYREVIFLYYFQDLKVKEISSLLNKNENTIKSRLKRAKELLKQHLKLEEGGLDYEGRTKRTSKNIIYPSNEYKL